MARLRALDIAVDHAVRRRKSAGSADVLDLPAFQETADREIGARRDRDRTKQDFSSDLLSLWDRAGASVGRLGIGIVESAPVTDGFSAAVWLDDNSSSIEDLLARAKALSERAEALRAMGEATGLPLDPRRDCNFADLPSIFAELSSQLERDFNQAQRWTEAHARLRTGLADCASARPSRQLESSQLLGDMIVLLQRAAHDDRLMGLVPPLVRWIGEKTNGFADPDAAVALREALATRASNPELHDATLSFLSVPLLQDLLRLGDDRIDRHVIVYGFRQSLASRSPAFLESIWGFAGWTGRASSVGDDLARLFESLRIVAATRGGANRAFLAVLEDPAESAADVPEHLRDTKAVETARQLGNVTAMSGHYYELRRIAFELYFRPLQALVQARRCSEVMEEVARLESVLRSEKPLEQIIETFEERGHDRHDLRESHRTSVRRYLVHQLGILHDWIREERTQDDEEDEPYLRELRPLLDAVSSSAPAVPPADPVATHRHLRDAVAYVIARARQGELPRSTHVQFGEISDGALPFEYQSNEAGVDTGSAWADLGLGLPGPHHLRLWIAQVRERRGPAWNEVLQDAIASTLLERDRKPESVLRALIDAREVDAALAAGDWPHYDTPECKNLLAKATARQTRFEELNKSFFQLADEAYATRRLDPDETEAQELSGIDSTLVDGLAAAGRFDFETADTLLASARTTLSRCSQSVRSRIAERDAHVQELRDWLEAASVPASPDLSAEDMEARRAQVLRDSLGRRKHVFSLDTLDGADVPEVLRLAIRRLRQELDHPSRWPSEAGAANAATYLEALGAIGGDWWRAISVLDPEDAGYRKVHAIASTLAEHLAAEIAHLSAGGGPESAPCLALLFERSSSKVADYHAMLVRAGLAVDVGPTPRAVGSATPVASEEMPPFAQAEEPAPQHAISSETPRGVAVANFRSKLHDELERAMHLTPSEPGSGNDVDASFRAFESHDVDTCRTRSVMAWRWAMREGKAETRDEMVALYGWSIGISGEADQRREALGMLLGLAENSLRRARLDVDRFTREWCAAFGSQAGSDPAIRLTTDLQLLAGAPAGSAERDGFSRVLRASDPARFAHLVWDAVRGQGEATTKARRALLRLLFDFEFDDAVVAPLPDEESHRYVRPFLALARRTSVEASSRLHAALQLSLRTLTKRIDIKPYKEFAESLVRDLGVIAARVALDVVGDLEKNVDGSYKVVVSVTPDEADPPIQLRIGVVEQDFRAVGAPSVSALGAESLLLERRELEFVVAPVVGPSATTIVIKAEGESASGQRIEETLRKRVSMSDGRPFTPLNADSLFEIYEGCRNKPVTGDAFIGRHAEMTQLENALVKSQPGAVILYGARRLGKTSLLDEMRTRYCVSRRGDGSRTLFLAVPVDSFQQDPQNQRPLASTFFKLISDSVRTDPKNGAFREMLASRGINRTELTRAAALPPDLVDTSFNTQLREYMGRLKVLSAGKVENIVLVFDEFDKMLESYRKGLQEQVEELVNQLRRAATEEHLGVVLAGSDLMVKVLGHYRSALYGSAVQIELSCFDKEESSRDAHQIIVPGRIRAYRDFTDAVVSQIIQLTGGHPLYMQIVAAAAAFASDRRTITPGTVTRAVQDLMRDNLLAGRISRPKALVTQPLQALGLLDSAVDESLARLLLLRLASHTSLEKPWLQWGRLSSDEALLSLRPEGTWTRLRKELEEAKVIRRDAKGLWSFRFPIMGEALRVGIEAEFEVWRARVEEAHA